MLVYIMSFSGLIFQDVKRHLETGFLSRRGSISPAASGSWETAASSGRRTMVYPETAILGVRRSGVGTGFSFSKTSEPIEWQAGSAQKT